VVVDTKPDNVLGVRPDASAQDIRRAFLVKARALHPDKNPDDPAATSKFQAVNEAYEVLKDPKLRSNYDQFGLEGLRDSNFEDFDLLAELFGFDPSPRTRSIRKTLEITLEEFYPGVQKTISYQRDAACGRCHGTGTKSGRQGRPCAKCGGEGILARGRQCPTCRGMGSVIPKGDRCVVCDGNGLAREMRQLAVQVERGAADGEEVVFEGVSDEVPGAETGSVIVKLKEKHHDKFMRNGADLMIEVKVGLAEALFGARIPIQHLDGHTLLVEGTRGDFEKTKVIHREGMPIKGDPFERGRLFVTFKIVMPDSDTLSDELRRILVAVQPPLNSIDGIDVDAENVFSVAWEDGDQEDFVGKVSNASEEEDEEEIDDESENCRPM
jgi:DnaJ-class molecular chaperone